MHTGSTRRFQLRTAERRLTWTLGCAAMLIPGTVLAQAARFANATDTIKILGETDLGDTYTIEAMVMRETGGLDSGRVFGEQLNAQEDKGFSVAPTGTGASIWNNGCGPSGVTTTALPVGEWHHVAYVRNGVQLTLFIDGVVAGSNLAACAGANAPGSNMAIGAFPYSLQSYVQPSFAGRIDWFRVSSTARYTTPFTRPSCEPVSDNTTLLLMLFNDPPGAVAPAESGPSHFAATVATGFQGATAPTFGLPGAPAGGAIVSPPGAAVCQNAGVQFSVAPAADGPVMYQWQLEVSPGAWMTLGNDPGPLPCGGNASFAYATPLNSPSVTIGVHGCPGSFKVRCLIVAPCGSGPGTTATVFVNPADIAHQGGIAGADGLYDNNDFVVFIDMFFNHLPSADVGVQGGLLGADGLYDNNDFVSFVNQFFGGC